MEPQLIDARAERSTNNALRLVFRDGPDEPFATGRQEAGGGLGRKLGVVSKDGAPTEITDGVGGPVSARVERGATSTALDPAGRPLLRFVARGEPKTPDLFCLEVQTPEGAPVATMDVVRKAAGWNAARVLLDMGQTALYWWNHPGKALPFPLLGVRVVLDAPLDGLARDVLLAACVDITIGLRPYIAEMN